MASSTEMILGLTVLALLSLQAFGQACGTNKDCQKTHPCKVGFPLCANGKCICSDAVVPDKTCASNADCQKILKCIAGFPLCANGKCICSDVKAGVVPDKTCASDLDCKKTIICVVGSPKCADGKCTCSDVKAVVPPNCSTNNDCKPFCQGRGTALCLQHKCSCI